jgi:hypothetical protein
MKIANCTSFFPVLIASSLLAVAAGCNRPPRPSTVTSINRATDDTIVSVTEMLRGGADAEAWRTYVQQLNHYLAGHASAQPRALSQEEQALLTGPVGLEKSELAEVASRAFTPLDAHYLELAFVLRDTARALNLDDLPPLDRVTSSFAWVIREVRLQQGEGPAVPPLPVLRRSWGTARERAFVFLALLDQLGIDGCMVALPAGGSGPGQLRDWVPGALVDNNIYLFDTRLGLPLPGPDGKGIATLAQVHAGLDLQKSLMPAADKYPYDVGPESGRQAEVQVAYSLSSLAPRMERLQSFLSASEKINLWVDPVARFKRFQDVAGTIKVWNSPSDVNNLLRVSRAFLPPGEGGVAQQPYRDFVRQQVVPWQYFPQQLNALPGDPGRRLRALFAAPFVYFSMEPKMPPELLVMWLPGLSELSADQPGTRKPAENLLRSPLPRELLLHGRFDEAAPLLYSMHRELERQKTRRPPPQLEEAVFQWSKNAMEAYSDLSRAEEAGKVRGKQTPSASAVAEAREKVNRLWGPQSAPVTALLQMSSSEAMLERVIYLLALCKQEQAERLQIKREHAGRLSKTVSAAEAKDGTEAWKSASSWWRTYLNEHPNAPAAPAARLLWARALQALGEREAAAALLENLTGVPIDLEKTARLYLAKQLKSR